MTGEQTFIIALLASMFFIMPMGLDNAFGDEECKEVGDNHGDTSESKKKFYKQLETHDFCEFVEDIDREEIEGAIREGTQWDWDRFVETKVFQTAFEDAIFCMLERYELPDDGKEHLAGYEIQDCGQGNY